MRIDNTWRDINSATVIDRITELGAISLLDADENDATELAELQNLDEQVRETGSALGWIGGYAMLIKDSYMEDHAQERAEQEGKISFNEWPATAIDWHEAAEELKFGYGYIPVDFFDSTYWVVK